MDPLRLAETLRRERQFVNRMLEEVGETNKSIKVSLDKLHIDSWVNYQLGSRLAVGSAFVTKQTTVNWTEIVQHLKKTRLLPAKKIITLEESSISLFLDKIRQEGSLIADLLVFAHEKSLDSSQFIRDLLPTIYGQLLLPEDVAYCQRVLKRLVHILVEKCAHPRVFLQGHESMFTLFFAEYAEYERSTRSYLVSILKPTVVKVVAESSWYMETDIFKAVLGLPEDERDALEGEKDEADGVQKSVEASIRIAERKLKQICTTLFESLLAHLPMLPKFLAELLHAIFSKICTKWKLDQQSPLVKSVMSAFIMDIIVVPALVNPERFGIVPSVCLEEKARFNLTQLATLLHAVPRVIEAQEMRKTDPLDSGSLLDTPAVQIVDSMDLGHLTEAIMDVVSRGTPSAALQFSEESIPLIPGLQRCSILATEEQVQRIVSLFVYMDKHTPNISGRADMKEGLKEALSVFSQSELSHNVILSNPYSVESVDTDLSSSTGNKLKAKGSPNPNNRKSGFKVMRRKRSESMETLSPPGNDGDKSQSLPAKIKHKRLNSATLAKMPRPASPPNTAVLPTFTCPVLPSCSLCGVSHDVLMIPLADKTDTAFEEFRVMSEKEFMKTLEKKQKQNSERNNKPPPANSPSQKDSSSSPSPSGSSSSFTNDRFDRKLERVSSLPISIVRSQSLEPIQKSGLNLSTSPSNNGGGVLSSSTEGSRDTTSSPEQVVEFDVIRRTKSLTVPRKPVPSDTIKMEPADSMLGPRPSLYVIDNMVTMSIEDFKADMPTLSVFKDSGLFATLKWKLRLALAKLPGNCLPLTPQLQVGGENPGGTPCVCNKDSKSIKDALLWMLYRSTSHIEWFHGPSMVNATVGVLFGDIYRWMVTLPEEYVAVLVDSICEEYSNRAHFIAYLVNLQQVLLDARTRISEVTENVKCDHFVLVDRCVEQTVCDFLDARKVPLQKFSRTMREMEAVDERCLYYQELLDHLTSLVQEESTLKKWSDKDLVLNTLEDHVLSLVQDELFYPNGDLDKARDDVFSHYLLEIEDSVTLNHESLQIPKVRTLPTYVCSYVVDQVHLSCVFLLCT
jgi:hypothetical protein